MPASDESSQEFANKSAKERVSFLVKSGWIWGVLIALIAFITSVAAVSVEYYARIAQQRTTAELNLRTEVILQDLVEQVQLVQNTINDINKSASQIQEVQLREQILQKLLLLQQQNFDIINTATKAARASRTLTNAKPADWVRLATSPGLPSIISTAAADQSPASPPAAAPAPLVPNLPPAAAASTPRFTQDDARLYVMLAVFIILGITFVVSIVAIFQATNADVLKFAFDTVKTLMGFFIGVATAFLGLPATPH